MASYALFRLGGLLSNFVRGYGLLFSPAFSALLSTAFILTTNLVSGIMLLKAPQLFIIAWRKYRIISALKTPVRFDFNTKCFSWNTQEKRTFSCSIKGVFFPCMQKKAEIIKTPTLLNNTKYIV